MPYFHSSPDRGNAGSNLGPNDVVHLINIVSIHLRQPS
jgi:hypothetical protein